jgi:hypothetical protein
VKSLIGVLLAAAAIGGSPPHFVQQSWADQLHGWATDGTVVYGTENGGRSWHRLLRANEDVFNLQRTSVRAGFVNASLHGFITIDAGRHWYFANIPGDIGHGHTVYWAEDSRVLRLLGWPPKHLRCRTGWIGEPNTFAPTPKPHNICDTPTVVRFRSKLLYVLHADPNDEISLAALVPGGVAGFVFTDCGEFCNEPVRVIVYRNGGAIVRTLPSPSFMFNGNLTLTVDWPLLVVTGPSGYWISDDGGDTWRFV